MTMINKAAVLKGTTVTLYEREEVGKDDLNRPVYEETAVEVENVLIGHPSDQEIIDVLNLTGRRLSYVLSIPKGDSHEWTNRKVSFFGKDFQVIGEPTEGLLGLTPLDWNLKVRVERINNG